MVKKLLRLLCAAWAVVAAQSVLAQDIIVLNNENADELEVKVIEVSDEVVKYRDWNCLDGPLCSLPIYVISVIRYQNGETQRFENAHTALVSALKSASASESDLASESASASASASKRLVYGGPYEGDGSVIYCLVESSTRTRLFSDFEPGVEGSITVGYHLGIGDYGSDAINCVDLNIGWRFSPYFWLGGTVGNTFCYDYFDPMTGFVTLLADVRGILPLGKKSALYGEFGFGGAFGYGDNDSNFQLRIGPGFKIRSISIAALYDKVGEEDAMLFQVGFCF